MAFVLALSLLAEEKVDLNAVHKIKEEAFANSNVMEYAFYLSDVYGPRLTNSDNHRKAADWAIEQLTKMGLKNARLETWGPFGRGWKYTKFSAHMIEPAYMPIIGFPQAWTPGTKGSVEGEPVLVTIKSEADMENYRGKLKGKIVMEAPIKELQMSTTALAYRYTDADLAGEAMAPDPANHGFSMPLNPAARVSSGRTDGEQTGTTHMTALRWKIIGFFADEGVLAVVNYGDSGDFGTIFADTAGSPNENFPAPPPTISITPEHYNRIARLIAKKMPVKLELNIGAEFSEASDSFNVLAEIPGSDKADEVVMIGAHLDSWHGGTGATDNAAGCAAALEAARILIASGVKLRRTVRIALWGGEEQGLLGSRAYVNEHFRDPQTLARNEEHAKLSAYFNLDNGTGKIRGIYMQGNDRVRPIFEAWLKPVNDLGAATVSIRATAGTDHQPFDAVGIPAFQFIQDPIEYVTRTQHSNMDLYDRLQKSDLMQAAAVTAIFLYNSANREELLPRMVRP
ncbi:MAG TPA: M20/M25/M40 family metallo-hydrolase [Bryobacteraceae bacterium]